MANDIGDFWKDYKSEQKERRSIRLKNRTEALIKLRDKGYQIEMKTIFQFRINGVLDIFLIHNLYHNIKTNQRGRFHDLEKLIKKELTNKKE